MEIMSNYRENLIIAADDFGMNSRANQRILKLAQSGKIDRVAVLVNRQFSREELDSLIASKVKLDLHLDMQQVSERGGAFERTVFFLFKYLAGGISSGKIAKKWEDQMEKFKQIFKKNPDGLNSHMHMHFFPPYFKIALKLASQHNIAYLRFGKSGIVESRDYVYSNLNFFWKRNVPYFRKLRLASSDLLISFDWIDNFSGFLEKLPAGKTEIIIHPERDDEYETINRYF